MPDVQTTISELQHQISIDTLVITDLRNKVEKWHGLAKDIVTVLGNNTDMFHVCMDNWIDLMVDTDERGTLKALAQNIVDRMHEIKHSEWNDPFSCMDKRTPVPDEYIPRPIPRHEYDMVCEASQHFSETYEQYTPEPLQDDCPPVFPQDHFLKWVTIYRPQTYNELLCEYNDFCKFNPEKADTL